MAKRLTRTTGLDNIRKIFPDISGKKVNIVLADGRVFFGTVMDASEDMLILQDMRSSRQKIKISLIEEIIQDY